MSYKLGIYNKLFRKRQRGCEMKILIRVSEILLGIIFLGAGLNGYVVLFGYEEIIPTSPAAHGVFQRTVFAGNGERCRNHRWIHASHS